MREERDVGKTPRLWRIGSQKVEGSRMRKKLRRIVLLGMLGLVSLAAWGPSLKRQKLAPGWPETVEELREVWRRAEEGDSYATAQLGSVFFWYQLRSPSGDWAEGVLAELQERYPERPSSKIALARRYRAGDGVEQNFTEARRLFLVALEMGVNGAYAELGELYFYGQGVPQSYPEALRLFREAARRGTPSAHRRLGDMYRDGLGVEASDEEAVARYRRAAEMGEDEAKLRLGEMYASGRGVEADGEEALRWIREAADRKVAAAQWWMASHLLRGADATDADREQGVEWLRKAALQGHELASQDLAARYAEGELGPRRLEAASFSPGEMVEIDAGAFLNNIGAAYECLSISCSYFFQRAVAMGDSRAALNLGLVHAYGTGDGRSAREAVRHFRNAAAQGLPEAMNELGNSYATGRGVLLDFAEAARWYRKAATADDANAQFNLGLLYVWGGGVEQDYRQAYEWLEQAASGGDPVAVAMRDRVGELLEAESSVQTAS
jgi:TPR repeat protein